MLWQRYDLVKAQQPLVEGDSEIMFWLKISLSNWCINIFSYFNRLINYSKVNVIKKGD